jgi:hypothetical protein
MRATVTPNAPDADVTVGDLSGYTPGSRRPPPNPDRATAQGAVTIARERWKLAGNV